MLSDRRYTFAPMPAIEGQNHSRSTRSGSARQLTTSMAVGSGIPLPVFSSTETVLEPGFPTARSGNPSPFRSAIATAAGASPAP